MSNPFVINFKEFCRKYELKLNEAARDYLVIYAQYLEQYEQIRKGSEQEVTKKSLLDGYELYVQRSRKAAVQSLNIYALRAQLATHKDKAKRKLEATTLQ